MYDDDTNEQARRLAIAVFTVIAGLTLALIIFSLMTGA